MFKPRILSISVSLTLTSVGQQSNHALAKARMKRWKHEGGKIETKFRESSKEHEQKSRIKCLVIKIHNKFNHQMKYAKRKRKVKERLTKRSRRAEKVWLVREKNPNKSTREEAMELSQEELRHRLFPLSKLKLREVICNYVREVSVCEKYVFTCGHVCFVFMWVVLCSWSVEWVCKRVKLLMNLGVD